MVIALITTYRHDYVPPATNRYRFLQTKPTNKIDCEQICKCAEKHPIPDTGKAAAAAARSCLKSEWTGIAPMGRLIEPRIIPETKSPEDEKVPPCQRDQPNRFLKILKTCYPDLYERLKNMPQDELHRRIDKERLRTTYQVDYCHLSEYPEGLYDSMEQNKKDEKSGLLKITDGCENFREDVFESLKKIEADDECLPARTVKATGDGGMGGGFNFSGGGMSSEKTDDTGHWAVPEFSKKPRISEYMDSISRTGCVIVRNDIHNHNKCRKGKNCVHPLKDPCVKV